MTGKAAERQAPSKPSFNNNYRLALADFADEIGFHARASSHFLDGSNRFRINDEHHADAHVKHVVHLFVGHAESLFGLTDQFRMIHQDNGTAYCKVEA